MKLSGLYLLCTLLVLSCGNPTADNRVDKELVSSLSGPFSSINVSEREVDPGNDSLWYHLVLDIPGELDFAVAQPTDESNRFGIRYQLLSDDGADNFSCKAQSSPAYDSAKLYPSFFSNESGTLIVLGDTGERQSWGQKVYLIDKNAFHDLGFIDMGTVNYAENPETDSLELSPQSIAEHITIEEGKKGLEFKVKGDKMVLFDDGNGNLNQIVPCQEWYYLLDKKGKWSLKRN